jgi:hypothetical protein
MALPHGSTFARVPGRRPAVDPGAAVVATRPVPVFEFEDLAGLPCGCVTAAFHPAEWGVTMVSIEARGPHCILPGHFVGQVVELAADGEEPPTEPIQQAA